MRHISRYVSRRHKGKLIQQFALLRDRCRFCEIRYTLYPDVIHIEISYEAEYSYADLFDEAQLAA